MSGLPVSFARGEQDRQAQNLHTGQAGTEHGSQSTDHGSASLRRVLSLIVLVLGFVFLVLFFVGCANITAKRLPPPPEKYIYEEEEAMLQTQNSLWKDSASLFSDRKARRLNDLVTINVVENISGSGKADTKTSRDSSADVEVTDIFGMNTAFKFSKVAGLRRLYKDDNVFEPKASGKAKSDFTGKGDTSREGKLIGTITAKVVEVMPNDNLVLESRKEITINNERQILVIRGMIRPDDIDADNSVSSSKIADADVYYVGRGVIQDKQSPGWLVRILDNVWPF